MLIDVDGGNARGGRGAKVFFFHNLFCFVVAPAMHCSVVRPRIVYSVIVYNAHFLSDGTSRTRVIALDMYVRQVSVDWLPAFSESWSDH